MSSTDRQTRQQARQAAFDYVIKQIFDLEDTSPLLKCFNDKGISSVTDIINMSSNDIDNLEYKLLDGTVCPVPVHLRNLVRILQSWNYKLIDIHKIRRIDWLNLNMINQDAFDEYRVSEYNPNQDPRVVTPSTSSTTTPTSSPSVPQVMSRTNLISDFMKGIKRDKSHYVVLKDEKLWHDWRRKTISTARTHGCANVLDSTYVPSDENERLLFSEQNKFLYDVFLSTIQTPVGKNIVREFESSSDAQAVWKAYSNHMRTSTRAEIEIEDLMKKLTTLRFDTTYKGTAESFIVDWLDLVRQFEDLTPVNEHFPTSVKKSLLQNAMSPSKAFRDVKSSEDLEIAKGRGPLAYDHYVSLLQKVAANLDKQRSGLMRRNMQEVNVNMFEDHDDMYDDDAIPEDDVYHLNQTKTIHPSNSTYRRPALPKAVWTSLTKMDQSVWDKMSDQGKRAVLFAYKNQSPHTPSDNPRVQSVSMTTIEPEEVVEASITENNEATVDQDDSILINAMKQRKDIPPSDIRKLLSEKARKIDVHIIKYNISVYHHNNNTSNSLVDRGANGGLAGSNMRVITKTDRMVDVTGIDDHELTGLPIVTAGCVAKSQRGDVILICHQYAYLPHGKTIHSSLQIEAFGNLVDDKSMKLKRGKQCIITLEGHQFPLDMIRGLPYLSIRPFTDREWNDLPHVVLTSDVEWDPTVYDTILSSDDTWYNNIPDNDGSYTFDEFDAIGTPIISISSHDFLASTKLIADEVVTDVPLDASIFDPDLLCHVHDTQPGRVDYEALRDYFLRVPADVIEKTFLATTQFARSGWITGHIRDTYRAPFPALNVIRRNEAVATDTIYFDTPAIDDGSTVAQFFVGIDSKFCDVYGIKTDSQFINTLWDVIRQRGAMDTLISDRAQVEISKKIKDILRHLAIKDHQSEPHYQHQNPSERQYKHVKANTVRVMNVTGAPGYTWLLCMQYVCFIMNRTAMKSLQWKTPYQVLTGSTPDISMIYRFRFYDKVYCRRDDTSSFPSKSNEILCYFVGFSESVGHKMTYKVLTADTNKILFRSRLRLADVEANSRADEEAIGDGDLEEDSTEEANDNKDENESPTTKMFVIDPDDLIGRSYLSEPMEDGTRLRLKIVEALDSHDRRLNSSPEHMKFRCKSNNDTYEELLTYSEIIDKIETEDGESGEWHFENIDAHSGPFTPSDKEYKGSRWNVRINWSNGETTWEPLSIIAKSDPISCAIYAKDNNLLHLDGWKGFARLARRQKKMLRMANQAKLKSFRNAPYYKFGVQVARNHNEAMELDKRNGNNKWYDAEQVELNQIDEYHTFEDAGHHRSARAPEGYKRITVHMVYDVKVDGRHKARLVAGGHLTETPIDSIYSSVVSLRGLKIVLFIAELNKLEVWNTDIGNAYLEAYTEEKLYILAGPEFGKREGHYLIIRRALYGLRSSGLRWWERFSEILHEMGFVPSKAEDDIWMRDKGSHYEYITRYVDDLTIVSKEPQKIINHLMEVFKLKLKGTGPIDYHLGCNFVRDKHGILCMNSKKYIERMIEDYVRMFGSKPRETYTSPLERGDHPELDDTEELDPEGIRKYQSLIGSLQWIVTIGRFDVATAVMTLSRFRAAPRKGHLERVQRIYGYLSKMRHGMIRFRTEIPDYSAIPDDHYSWEKSIYGNVHEEIPADIPTPKGLPVVSTTYVDANLMHDILTGKSVTGILHLLNKTPIDSYTKRQPVVETATYGSEFMAARTATEQIIDLRLTLRYLGVPIQGHTYLFGDNKTVVHSCGIPKSRLHKRHVLLSFHRVREAIAAGIMKFIYIPGSINPADILSKAWGYQQVKMMLKALLFWEGDTTDLLDEDEN